MKSIERPAHSPKMKRTGLRVLGRLIREARKERGLTQAQVAKSIGKGRSTMARIERGENPSLHHRTVHLIARALGISPLRLIWGAQRSLLKGKEHVEPIRVIDELVAALEGSG